MSAWFASGAISILLLALVLPLALLPIVKQVYRRYHRFAGWPALVAFGSLATACGLIAFTLFPLPGAIELNCDLRSTFDYWVPQPLASVEVLRLAAAREGMPGFLSSGAFLQVAFNVLLFVPIGFFAHQLLRKPAWVIIGLGLALSIGVELTQGTAVYGLYDCPYRVAEFDDLLTNTTGTAIGVGLSALGLRHLGFMHPVAYPVDGPLSLRRRLSASLLDVVMLVVVSVALQVFANIVVAGLSGLDYITSDTMTAVRWVLAGPVAALLVGLAVPLVRNDGATFGQAAVMLGVNPIERSRRLTLLLRWLVRWLPIVVIPGLYGSLVWIVEWLVALARSDRRSLAGVVAGSETVPQRGVIASTHEGQDQQL